MNRRMLLLGVGLNLVFVLACISSAEVGIVERDGQGGTLALTGDYEDASEEAQEMMKAHCNPQPFQVLHEERVVVGTRMTQRGQERAEVETRGGITGTRTGANTKHRSVSVESDEYELQVTYICGVVQRAPAAHAAPSVPAPAPESTEDAWREPEATAGDAL